MDTGGTVFFISPPFDGKLYRGSYCTYVSKATYVWQPQDFILISAQVPQKYQVEFLDCNTAGLSEKDIFNRILGGRPLLAVVSISTIALEEDLLFLRKLRSFFKDLKVLVLGDILLEEEHWPKVLSLGVDIVLNPMDIDLERYINTGTPRSDNIVLSADRGRVSSIDDKKEYPREVSIGIPRHEVFKDTKYRNPFIKSFLYTVVTTQFGCPFRCSYCSCSRIPVTYRGYNEILRELDTVKKLNIRDIFFGDPSFGFPPENAAKIVEGMIDGGYGFKWCCYFNPNLGERSFLEKMKKSGCHTVIIGIEDKDTEKLRSLYGRDLAEERLWMFIKDCRDTGIKICGDFIVGLNSAPEAFEKMVDLAIEADLDYASFNIMVPLMGSGLRREMIARGEIMADQMGYDTSGTTGREDPGLIVKRNIATRKFYLRPGYILKRLFSMTTVAEFIIHAQEMQGLVRNTLFKKSI